MDVTLSGIVMDFNPAHLAKARPPMDVTLSGIVMDANAAHPLKARSPMDVMLPRIVMDVTPAHLEKASLPMDVTAVWNCYRCQPSTFGKDISDPCRKYAVWDCD